MKTCFKCQQELPISDFYKHPRMADGHLGKCKVCTKDDVKKRYDVKRVDPTWITAERHRGREKYERLNYAERYRGKSHVFQSRYKERWPNKWKARGKVNNAVRDGRLEKPEQCQDCGSVGRIHGHHPDYTKPLEVIWLCAKCHGKRHRKEDAA